MRVSKIWLSLPAAVAATGHPLANIVNLLKTVQKETQESMDLEEKTLGDFECAKKKTDKHMSVQKSEAEDALKEAQQELDMVLNGATLTDESVTLAAKVQELDKAIKAAADEIEAEKNKTEAAVAALNEGITALANAVDKLSAGALIEMSSTVRHLIPPKTMSALPDAAQLAVSTALSGKTEAEQSPEQYEKQAGAVKKFMTELMISYKKEIISTEQDWKKTDAAFKAKKQTLEEEKSATQKEAGEGAKELAAKEAKEKELTDTINLSNDLIKQANDEMKEKTDAYEKALKDYQDTMADLEAQMDALTEALKVLTSEEGRDKREALHAATSLIQRRTKTVRQQSKSEALASVFQLIMTKIDDFVTALESQTSAMQRTIASCEKKSKEALTNLRDTAVFYDEENLKRDNAQDQIDTKTEKVEQLAKKTADEMENLANFEKECDEEVADLTELSGKQADVKQLIEQAFAKLQGYPDANTKFKTVFTLFQTELAKAQGEVDKLSGEISATNTRKSDEQARVGVPPTEDGLKAIGECNDDIAVCAAKETVLCDLRTNIDDLCNGITTEEGKKTAANANMGTSKTSLDSMLTSFADAQPGCDTPMINGPAQITANGREIDELKQAKTVLSAYDTQDIGQGANYTVADGPADATDANWDAAATGMF